MTRPNDTVGPQNHLANIPQRGTTVASVIPGLQYYHPRLKPLRISVHMLLPSLWPQLPAFPTSLTTVALWGSPNPRLQARQAGSLPSTYTQTQPAFLNSCHRFTGLSPKKECGMCFPGPLGSQLVWGEECLQGRG